MGEEQPGAAGEITAEQALAAHPDLTSMLEKIQEDVSALRQLSEDLEGAARTGLAAPGAAERSVHLQFMLGTWLDRIAKKIDAETDAIRIELLEAMYRDVFLPFQQIAIGMLLSQSRLKDERRPHEYAIRQLFAMHDQAAKQRSGQTLVIPR